MPAAAAVTLSTDEAAVYDRQLRVWGLEAQTRMRNSRILVTGAFNGLAAEIIKNLALAGVGSITVADNQPITSNDLDANFFLHPSDLQAAPHPSRPVAAHARIQALNTLCIIHVRECTTSFYEQDELWQSFDAVMLIEVPVAEVLRIDHICRRRPNRPLPLIACWMFLDRALSLTDLTSHSFTTTRPAKNDELPSSINGHQEYPSLQDVFSLSEEQLLDMMHCSNSKRLRRSEREIGQSTLGMWRQIVANNVVETKPELSAHCAIFGGILAQEVIKIVSCKEEPHFNCISYLGDVEFQACVRLLAKKLP